MKKAIFILATALSVTCMLQAQSIQNFETGFTGEWGTNGNTVAYPGSKTDFSIVDNPSKTGINETDKVGKFIRYKNGDWWGYAWFQFSPVQITASSSNPAYLHIMVYKSIASRVCAQVKDKNNAPTADTGEILSDKQTKVNEWQDVVFKITTPGTFAYLEFKPDFVNASPANRLTDNLIVYFDEILVSNDPAPRGYKGDIPESFEGENTLLDADFWNYRFGVYGQTASETDIVVADNPDKTGVNTTNKCGRFSRKVSGEWWAGFYMVPKTPVNINENNKYIHVMCYKPAVTPVNIKLEDGTPVGTTGDVLSLNQQANVHEWQDFVFEIPADKYGVYQKINIMPDFVVDQKPDQRYSQDEFIYFDEIVINNSPAPRSSSTPTGNKTINKINIFVDRNAVLFVENVGAHIEVFSLDGKVVYRNMIKGNSADLSFLQKGSYVIKVTHEQGVFTTKLVF